MKIWYTFIFLLASLHLIQCQGNMAKNAEDPAKEVKDLQSLINSYKNAKSPPDSVTVPGTGALIAVTWSSPELFIDTADVLIYYLTDMVTGSSQTRRVFKETYGFIQQPKPLTDSTNVKDLPQWAQVIKSRFWYREGDKAVFIDEKLILSIIKEF